MIAATFLLGLALVSYRPSDPALNTAAAGPVGNWAGPAGAYGSDLMLSLWGPPAGLLLPLMLVIGVRLMRGAEAGRWLRAVLLATLGIILIGTGLALLFGCAVNGIPAGLGGASGLWVVPLVALGLGALARTTAL